MKPCRHGSPQNQGIIFYNSTPPLHSISRLLALGTTARGRRLQLHASSLAALTKDPSSMDEEKVKSKYPKLHRLPPPVPLRELTKRQSLSLEARVPISDTGACKLDAGLIAGGLRLEGPSVDCLRPHMFETSVKVKKLWLLRICVVCHAADSLPNKNSLPKI